MGRRTAWAASRRTCPAFVVFSTGTKGPSGGNSNWGSGFLPTVYQGVQFRSGGDPVLYLSNPRGVDAKLQRDSLDAINSSIAMHLDEVGDPGNRHADQFVRDGVSHAGQRPEADGYLAASRSTSGDVRRGAGQAVVRQQCLLARRLVERGVRFVQIFHEAWDQHGNLTHDMKTELQARPTRPARRWSRI